MVKEVNASSHGAIGLLLTDALSYTSRILCLVKLSQNINLKEPHPYLLFLKSSAYAFDSELLPQIFSSSTPLLEVILRAATKRSSSTELSIITQRLLPERRLSLTIGEYFFTCSLLASHLCTSQSWRPHQPLGSLAASLSKCRVTRTFQA